MISGALDSISVISPGVYRIGGWAIFRDSDEVCPVEKLYTESAANIIINRADRKDIIHTGQFGFYIDIPDDETLGKFFFNALPVFASCKGERLQLAIWDKLQQKIARFIASSAITKLTPEVIFEILRATKINNNNGLPRKNPDLEQFLIQVGSISLDGSTIVGKNGHLFLYGGTNSVHNQYYMKDTKKLSKSWAELISHRKNYIEKIGMSFFQIVIPEKQSVLAHLYPINIQAPSPIFGELNYETKADPAYINILDIFKEAVKVGLDPFRKVDTHLSFFGAFAIVKEILRVMNVQIEIPSPSLQKSIASGDLGDKLFKGRLYEDILIPNLENWEFAQISPVLTYSLDPPTGHVGTQREWYCEKSLINKKVVIFGNSMFERGGDPFGLCWWFSRIFKESTFVWSAKINLDVIHAKKPDFVFAQTIERFLKGVPEN